MYSYPGEYLVDFALVKRDDEYHIFHIRGERWTWSEYYRIVDLGHAVSKDLRVWEPKTPVVPVGPPGSWDEIGIWAPHVVEAGGIYHMYYTGVDAKINQGIGLATSTDLYRWEKHPGNPVVRPGPWSDVERGESVACRDAMVFADTKRGRYLMYYTATMADGRPCIGLAGSSDLFHWADLGPAYVEEDRSYNRLESAFVVPKGDKYYLFYSAKGGPRSHGHRPEDFAHFELVYQVSDDPTGGWAKPRNHVLLGRGVCASEHLVDEGVAYTLFIVSEELEGIWGAQQLSDPKITVWMPDGTVRIQEHVPDNVERRPLFSSDAEGFADWASRGGEWCASGGGVVARSGQGEAYLTNTLWGRDLAFEAELRGEGDSIGSLVVRGNPSALAGYRVSLDFARRRVALVKRFPGAPDSVLQERDVELGSGEWHRLKVVVQGKFFEVYVDDGLVIVQDSRTYDSGCFGLHASGQVSFRAVQAYEYVGPPSPTADNWASRCLPGHIR